MTWCTKTAAGIARWAAVVLDPGRGHQQHQARHHHLDPELALVGLDQHDQRPKQPKQHGS
jgi:hypothetical protein